MCQQCQKRTRKGRVVITFGMETNLVTVNSIIPFIFQNDTIFINYSREMTMCQQCQKRTRIGRTIIKFRMETNEGTANLNIPFIYQNDTIFINYS